MENPRPQKVAVVTEVRETLVAPTGDVGASTGVAAGSTVVSVRTVSWSNAVAMDSWAWVMREFWCAGAS